MAKLLLRRFTDTNAPLYAVFGVWSGQLRIISAIIVRLQSRKIVLTALQPKLLELDFLRSWLSDFHCGSISTQFWLTLIVNVYVHRDSETLVGCLRKLFIALIFLQLEVVLLRRIMMRLQHRLVHCISNIYEIIVLFFLQWWYRPVHFLQIQHHLLGLFCQF